MPAAWGHRGKTSALAPRKPRSGCCATNKNGARGPGKSPVAIINIHLPLSPSANSPIGRRGTRMPGGFPPISPGESGLPAAGKTKRQEVRPPLQPWRRAAPRSPSVIGLRPLTAPSRTAPVAKVRTPPPQQAPERLPLNSQGSNAANLQRVASAASGNSGDPLQPEPPLVAAARPTHKDGAGGRGNRLLRSLTFTCYFPLRRTPHWGGVARECPGGFAPLNASFPNHNSTIARMPITYP